MKGSLISSLVLTTLLVITSLFQPHHHNNLVSAQNNTDEGANICIGLQCRIVVDDKTDLFMNQPTARSSRMLSSSPNTITYATNTADKPPQCPPNTYYGGSSCIKDAEQYTRRPSCKNGRPTSLGYCPK